MKNALLLYCFLQAIASVAFSQVQLGSTSLDTVVLYSSLNEPWEIKMGIDSNLWLTEKRGIVSIIDPSTGTKSVLLDIEGKVWQNGESGLLGMTFSPNFMYDSLLFLAYTYESGSNRFLKIVHYAYSPSSDSLLNEVVIVDSIAANTYHIGCRLLFMQDSTLLITTGDAGTPNFSQDKSKLAGKVLRVHKDGSIPTDNPNTNSPIFSSGHRNPQGLYGYRNKVYSSEHGASTNDEINMLTIDSNYGWPNVEGYCDLPQEIQFCTDSLVQEPMYAWTPTVATSDIVVYDHPAIPEWRNSILLTTLKNQSLISLQMNSTSDSIISTLTHFSNYWGRLRDICIGYKGEIYLVTNGFTRNGNQGQHMIVKIENLNYVGLAEAPQKVLSYIIYPNPSTSRISIQDFPPDEFLAGVFDVKGKLIFNRTVLNGELHIADLPSGIYFLRIPEKNLVLKFVKN